MSVKLYDLSLEGPTMYWSPNTCKTRFALELKGIPYEVEFLNFFNLHSKIPLLTKTGKRPTVPVIEDLSSGRVVQDSWDIAQYLEEAFPNTPTLFPGGVERHKYWNDAISTQLLPVLFKFVVLDVCARSGSEEMVTWFRKNREEFLGTTLEAFAGSSEDNHVALRLQLEPMHDALAKTEFLTGDQVGLADTTLAAIFQFLAVLRPDDFKRSILETFDDDVLGAWWERMKPYRTGPPLGSPASPRL